MKNRKTYKILTIIGACFLFVGMPVNRFYLGLIDGIFDEAMSKHGFMNTNVRNNLSK